jgi:single-strand DNA-binding protein
MGLNKAFLIGNVGKDPEVRQAGQSPVANFSLATSDRRFKDEDGKPRTEWHNIVAWGKLAEIIGQYVKKGDMLYLEGRIQTRKWQDKDGNNRYTTEVVADQMEMLGGRNVDRQNSAQPTVLSGTVPPPADDPGF